MYRLATRSVRRIGRRTNETLFELQKDVHPAREAVLAFFQRTDRGIMNRIPENEWRRFKNALNERDWNPVWAYNSLGYEEIDLGFELLVYQNRMALKKKPRTSTSHTQSPDKSTESESGKNIMIIAWSPHDGGEIHFCVDELKWIEHCFRDPSYGTPIHTSEHIIKVFMELYQIDMTNVPKYL